MFETFTERARRVVVFAQAEARMLNHDYIGTEHLLLGVLREGESIGAHALTAAGVSLESARRQLEDIIGAGDAPPTGHIPFTPRAKKVLRLSLEEAQQLGHLYVGAEHLLLGLIREGTGVAAQIIVKLAGDLDRVRGSVVDGLRAEPTEGVPRSRAFERTMAVTISAEEDSGEWPLCPVCRASLHETLARATIRARNPDADDRSPMVIAYCGGCGTAVGPQPI